MKFSKELKLRINEPWRDSYIRYTMLNDFLKEKLDSIWTRKDENEFVGLVDVQLKKVYRFAQTELGNIDQRINQCNTLLERQKNKFSVPSSFDHIADTLAEILADLDELAKFREINLAAFQKIIKKHDTYVPNTMRILYFQQMLDKWPLDTLRFDIPIVRISEIYDMCHQRDKPHLLSNNNEWIEQTAFERATNKYWIHPDHVTEVKALILLHLPVHVFNQKKPYEASDAAVSSVYYDNDNLDLYYGRLNRTKGAEAIRMRWYGKGNDANNYIYIERKTHQAEWLGGKSIKDRFRLKESQVNDFIDGKYTAEDFKQELERNGKMKKGRIENHYLIAKGIQESITSRKLKPVCRVFYNRTAFQLPGNQKLRISIDSDMTFIREDHMDAKMRRPVNNDDFHWRRSDVNIDYPFRNVNEKDIVRFPYAILETKIQTHLGQEAPEWLTNLLNSHLVHEVSKFSKYVHGSSCLLKDYVSESPEWLQYLDMDIRKSPAPGVGLSRSESNKALFNGHHRRSLASAVQATKYIPIGKTQRECNGTLFNWGFDDNKVDTVLGMPVLGNEKFEKTNLHIKNNQGFLSQVFSRLTLQGKKEGQEPLQPSPSVLEQGFKKSPSRPFKKLDPKAFFSNERTFMSWLQFCAILFTISLNLINGGDGIARIMGSIFIVVSSFVSMYALARFHLRAFQLRTGRRFVRIDDIYGPGVLCALLVIALAANFYLRYPLLFLTDRNKVLFGSVGK